MWRTIKQYCFRFLLFSFSSQMWWIRSLKGRAYSFCYLFYKHFICLAIVIHIIVVDVIYDNGDDNLHKIKVKVMLCFDQKVIIACYCSKEQNAKKKENIIIIFLDHCLKYLYSLVSVLVIFTSSSYCCYECIHRCINCLWNNTLFWRKMISLLNSHEYRVHT